MKSKLFLGLLIVAITLFTQNTNAQVTIGSTNPPVAGSLLQLKENENTVNNATRGLGMPRVKLTDKTKLQPMYSYADAANTPSAAVAESHTGLVVYHIDKCSLAGTGMYVWDGEAWQSLNQDVISLEGMTKKLGTAQEQIATNGVAWHKDHEGNIFFSMNYDVTNLTGSNNRWMTTNLAAKTYGARTGGGAIPANPTNTYANSYTAAYWGYPNQPSTTTAGLSTEYDKRQRLGLLYNYAAATGNQNSSTANQGGTAHAGVQGICPAGWHLPTDYEWTQLETEVKVHASKYSGLPDNTANPGFAMMDMCEANINQNSSNAIINGGFAALLAGVGYNGSSHYQGGQAYFWTSSSANNIYIWYRALIQNAPQMLRHYSDYNGDAIRPYMFSVRCKKDNTPPTPTTPVSSITLNKTSAQQYVVNGTDYATPTTTQLTATVLPADATNKNVTWTSADSTIANVSSTGLVTSVKNGRTTITATTVEGGKTASADIVVGCGAYTAAGKWAVFMCHNLGADTSKDPLVPTQDIAGNYYQWGKPAVIATAYTSPDPIGEWTFNNPADKAWNSGTEADPVKTANDPCPTGYRIPTDTEWLGVIANNTTTSVGTWSTITTDHTKFGAGRKFGGYLFFPAAGSRHYNDGILNFRGFAGLYWSSTEKNTHEAWNMNVYSGSASHNSGSRINGGSVRCKKDN